MTLRQLDQLVERWNKRNPVGTPVIYRSVLPDAQHPRLNTFNAPGISTCTTTLASLLGNHTAVVFVEGVSGCVALEALEVVEQ